MYILRYPLGATRPTQATGTKRMLYQPKRMFYQPSWHGLSQCKVATQNKRSPAIKKIVKKDDNVTRAG